MELYPEPFKNFIYGVHFCDFRYVRNDELKCPVKFVCMICVEIIFHTVLPYIVMFCWYIILSEAFGLGFFFLRLESLNFSINVLTPLYASRTTLLRKCREINQLCIYYKQLISLAFHQINSLRAKTLHDVCSLYFPFFWTST